MTLTKIKNALIYEFKKFYRKAKFVIAEIDKIIKVAYLKLKI